MKLSTPQRISYKWRFVWLWTRGPIENLSYVEDTPIESVHFSPITDEVCKFWANIRHAILIFYKMIPSGYYYTVGRSDEWQ